MQSYPSFLPLLVCPLVCFAVVLLILKLATKLKTLTVVCLAVLAATIVPILGIRFIPSSSYIPSRLHAVYFKLWLFLPATICALILIAKFVFRLFESVSSETVVTTAERDRILRMVEEAKITAQEGSELLDAIGKSSALRGEEKFSRVDILMLVGVALVVLGFFLPWAYISMAQVPGPFGRVSGYQAGYHTGALGWTIFIIGIASAIPVFVTPRNLLYKISMMQIFLTLIGLILVISVLVRAGNHLGLGLVFCLIGFIVGLLAAIAKLKSLAT